VTRLSVSTLTRHRAAEEEEEEEEEEKERSMEVSQLRWKESMTRGEAAKRDDF